MASDVLATVDKPVLDEDAFQQLLAAAYVIQQQTDELQMAEQLARASSGATANSEGALAIIAETQERLRSQTCDISLAAKLVVEGLQRITSAQGVAIALERGGMLEYVSAAGSTSNMAGVKLPMPVDLLVSYAGMEATQEISLNAIRQAGGDQNDIALPLTHDGKVAGIVEVRFAGGRIVEERELRCCQLMAGLMTEAVARAAEAEWKQALAAEREAMLEELERIMPQIDGPIVTPAEETQPPALMETPTQVSASEVSKTPAAEGKAQAPERAGSAKPRRAERSGKRRAKASEQPATVTQAEDQNVVPVQAEAQALAVPESQPLSLPFAEIVKVEKDSQAISVAEVSQPHTEVGNPWISSGRARRWLESLQTNAPARQWIDMHRADLYLAVAIVMLVLAIGSFARGPHPAAAQTKGPPQPSLSLFERILVALDLAEPPATPVYPGNPNTTVWVDLHTALYYCPGAELYGRTAGGKFTTQRDAQIDQFQPAGRKSCN